MSLQIKVTGDISDAQKKLKELSEGVANSVAKSSVELSKLNSSATSVLSNLSAPENLFENLVPPEAEKAVSTLSDSALGLAESFVGAKGVAIASAAVGAALLLFGDDIKALFIKTDQLTQKQLDLLTANGLLEKSTFKTAQAVKEYREIIEKTFESAAGEASRVALLVNALEGQTLSRRQQIAAVKELQQLAPQQFENISREKIDVLAITKAYAAYNSSLITLIENQIRQQELTKLVTSRLKIQDQYQEATLAINAQIAAGKSLSEIQKKTFTDTYSASVKKAATAITDNNVAVGKLPFSIYKAQLAQERRVISNVDGQAQIIKALIEEKNLISKISKEGLDLKFQAPEKVVKNLSKAVEKAAINAPLAFDLKAFNPKDLQIATDIPPVSIALKSKFDSGSLKDLVKDIPDFVFKETGTVDIVLDVNKAIEQGRKAGQEFSGSFSEGVKLNAVGLEISEAFNSILTGSLNSVADGVSEVVSSIALGGGVNEALNAGLSLVAGQIGGFVEQFGRLLIDGAIQILALKKATEKLIISNPQLALVIGIGALAAGKLIKTAVQKKSNSLPKFAEGGVASRATLGIFGEAGTEAIVPLKQLSRIVQQLNPGRSSEGGNVVFELSGNNLYGSIERTKKLKNINT